MRSAASRADAVAPKSVRSRSKNLTDRIARRPVAHAPLPDLVQRPLFGGNPVVRPDQCGGGSDLNDLDQTGAATLPEPFHFCIKREPQRALTIRPIKKRA